MPQLRCALKMSEKEHIGHYWRHYALQLALVFIGLTLILFATFSEPAKSEKKLTSDVFISVKTTGRFHRSRLDLILDTWFRLAPEQIFFFTDEHDETIQRRTNGHLKVTSCPPSHSRQALACKMDNELKAFRQSGKRWFCHFDDDNYVNIPALMNKLNQFDHSKDFYLGKNSIPRPLQIIDRDDMQKNVSFWFGTGGAGFCLSGHLVSRMTPMAGDGRFEALADRIRLPDDVAIGFVCEHLLRVPLTVVDEFHSHLEPMRLVTKFKDQISFGYGKYGNEMNVVNIKGKFSEDEDPTRFRSLHCHLFPSVHWC